ncbi:MAG: histidine phosphatase family protein [Caldilineaceae bacterium]|nr:histidine phosphatase family protein [Caldilineaceae bacterium]
MSQLSTVQPAITIYLARHATPNRTTGIRYDVAPGPPILPEGEEEAARLGAYLKSVGVQQIYASPLLRTQMTAQIAAAASGIEMETEEMLAEWVNGEKDADVLARLWPFWERLCGESADDGPIAIVSHGGPIRVLLEELGVAKDEVAHYCRHFDYGNPLPPAGAWRATRALDADAKWAVDLVFTPKPYTPFNRQQTGAAAPAQPYPIL